MNNSTQDAPSLDVERQRQEAITELAAELGPNWAEQYAPGTFGCHELLDRALLAAETVEESVLAHPACAESGVVRTGRASGGGP